jgi:hypothetical protein
MIEVWELKFTAEVAITQDWSIDDRAHLQREILDCIRQHSTALLVGDYELDVAPKEKNGEE